MTTSRITNAFMTIVAVTLAAAIGLADSKPASAAITGDIRVMVGAGGSQFTMTYHPDSCGTAYWHCDEGNFPGNTALDLTENFLGSDIGGNVVHFQAYGYSGYAYGVTGNHKYGVAECPGVDIAIWIPYPNSSQGTWVGPVNLVQIDPSVQFGTQFYIGTSWTVFGPLGYVHDGEGEGDCTSTGSHLHQSGPSNSSTVYTNWSADGDDNSGVTGRQITPTSSTTANWLHWITYYTP